MNIHCRLCGYLLDNVVTQCCIECDATVAWAMKELRDKGISEHCTYDQAQSYLHNGTISQDTFEFYVDIWNIASIRLSVSESTKRDSLNRLQQLRGEAKMSKPRIPKLSELEQAIRGVNNGIVKAYTIEIDPKLNTAAAALDTRQYDMKVLSRLNLIYTFSFWGGSLDGRIKSLRIRVIDDRSELSKGYSSPDNS